MRTTLLIGPPGTGKTTSLLDRVEQALADGVPPDRIAYLAFTRKAADEAISRASARFGYGKKDFKYFRTLHSLAFKSLGLSREEVMGADDYAALSEYLPAYTFEHQYGEGLERCPIGGGLGDRCMQVYSMAKATCSGWEDAWRVASNPEMDFPTFKRFVDVYQEYKRGKFKVDFTDFLPMCHDILDVDLFILDEAQDLTRQQWEYARRTGAAAPSVLIAGDDDQAIFQWAGADWRMLLALEGNRIVLPQSHRLPEQIFGVTQRLAHRISVRHPKDWTHNGERGEVHYIAHPEQLDLGQGKWLLLARHRYQLSMFEDVCRDQGVVYSVEGSWSNRSPSVKAVVGYERLRRGGVVDHSLAKLVAKFAQIEPPPKDIEELQWANFAWPFDGKPDWMDALPTIGGEQREYIRKLRRRGESLTKEGRVQIATIHSVKGGEADNVALLTDITRQTYDNMTTDYDQELRVWYVGVSRAKERLFIITPTTKRFFEV